MTWTVVYTEQAHTDLWSIHDYISSTLCAPRAASRLIDRILDAVEALEEYPERFRLLHNGCHDARYEIRIMPVGNYAVLFFADTDTTTVNVIRIAYGARDIPQLLNGL